MNKGSRVVSITFLILFSVVTAAFAGACLALWDTGETVQSVYAMAKAYGNNEPVVASTQTIVKAGVELPKKQDVTLIIYDEKPSIDAKLPENFKPVDNGENNEAEDIDEQVLEEETAEEEEEIIEEEPVKITKEIAGIKEITRAGTDEIIVTGAKVPSPGEIYEGEDFPDPTLDFPREFTEVDESYFDDALFIGDSRMQGLGMYSHSNATFYAATAFQLFQYVTFKVVPTSNGKVPIFDAMPYNQFTKIYIKVGLNELGCVSEEKFVEVYSEFIERLRIMQPRAIIYIHAVLPVTAAKSATDKTHCNEKITARNEVLKNFAQMNNCYFIDAGPAFSDETGALLAESTVDGIHMYSKYMDDWMEFLRKNAVPWP